MWLHFDRIQLRLTTATPPRPPHLPYYRRMQLVKNRLMAGEPYSCKKKITSVNVLFIMEVKAVLDGSQINMPINGLLSSAVNCGTHWCDFPSPSVADTTDILQTPFNPCALIPDFLCSGKQMIRFWCWGCSSEGTFHQDWNICHHTLTHEGVSLSLSLFVAICVLYFFFSFHNDKCTLCVDSTSGDVWLTKLRFILSITCRLKCPIKVIDRFLAWGTVEGEELCSSAQCCSTLWMIVDKKSDWGIWARRIRGWSAVREIPGWYI